MTTQIAKFCHEINRAYCNAIGDKSQVPWDAAPRWQKESAIAGVDFTIANPDAPPSANHDNWMAQKAEEGWTYGPTKDAQKKTHPAFLPYEELPIEQRIKDYLFRAVVEQCVDLASTKGR